MDRLIQLPNEIELLASSLRATNITPDILTDNITDDVTDIVTENARGGGGGGGNRWTIVASSDDGLYNKESNRPATVTFREVRDCKESNGLVTDKSHQRPPNGRSAQNGAPTTGIMLPVVLLMWC